MEKEVGDLEEGRKWEFGLVFKVIIKKFKKIISTYKKFRIMIVRKGKLCALSVSNGA